jgi:hypothetical protein
MASEVLSSRAEPQIAVYTDGIRAGVLGAAAIALWFLVVDTIAGRPFYTPTVLGTALFQGGAGLDAPEALAADAELVLSFTWVHVLAFVLIGLAASHLLALAERSPHLGFGIVLLFVLFQFGFFAACMVLAEPVLHALAWPAILVGNLLAAAVMAETLRRRHATLAIRP